ncbi:adhesin [Pantoea sp. Acro-835]|uniref:Adhesin n=1 Tax=Candidatus Pantoea multigeneris TaxID=2608357 RepID=A0ABX0RIJ6_9GAMM|nr:adhesin [Pantoea multigeneris]
MPSSELYAVNGIQTLKLVDGIGLVPRAFGSASYTDYFSSGRYHVTGTIGFPQTRGENTAGNSIVVPFTIDGKSRDWCLPPKNTTDHYTPYFYKAGSYAHASVNGDWAIVADGNQTAQDNIKIMPMYVSTTLDVQTDYRTILPTNVDLRISTLSCSVDTPTEINFGAVARNLTPHAELAQKNNELYVACSQDSTGPTIDANINVQFRPLSGLYNGEINKLALNEGGGYITGSIPGVTSEGHCGSAAAGVTFDNKPIKVGSIAKGELSIRLNHQIDWRLCSGGASLPSGKVTASTEMLVTYN